METKGKTDKGLNRKQETHKKKKKKKQNKSLFK